MIVTKEIEIDMGHAVTYHNSKCRHAHGHRYLIRACVDGNVIDEKGHSSDGMVIDFSDLKRIMMDKIDAYYDHAFVIWEGDPRAELYKEAHELWHNDANRFHIVDFIPTAENLAAHWFRILDPFLKEEGIKLYELQVYETPTSCAICKEEDAYKETS